MSNLSAGTTTLAAYDAARRTAALQGGAKPASPGTAPPPTVTAATVQAQQGASLAKEPPPEPFNAPMLDIPENATTLQVMAGLTKAMADPTVNSSTAKQLFSLHEQLMQAEKAMTQVIVDGMLM